MCKWHHFENCVEKTPINQEKTIQNEQWLNRQFYGHSLKNSEENKRFYLWNLMQLNLFITPDYEVLLTFVGSEIT